MADASALVLIDVQQGLIDGFEDDWRDALAAVSQLVAQARASGAPVVFVQHCGQATTHPLHPTRAGWALHPGLDVRASDVRVEKTWSDAFRDTNLDAVLRGLGATRIVLAGAQTEFCVDTTARRALSLGFDVDLAADGHTTSGNGLLTREQIVRHHNQTLANLATAGATLTVVPSAQIDFH